MPRVDQHPPRRVAVRVFVTLLGITVSAGAFALDTLEAEKLVFVLQHVDRDYGRAVDAGRVVNNAEYDEVVASVGVTRERFVADHPAGDEAKVAERLAQLEAGVRNREPSERVSALIGELIQTVSSEGGGLPVPGGTPDLVRGRELYLRDCAPCHGKNGAGDGFAAPGMIPAPVSLTDPSNVGAFSPQHVWGAIQFGIEGTAHPSYEEAYASGEAWDVASYVVTLKDTTERPSGNETDLDVARRLERTFTSLADRVLPEVVGLTLFRRQTEPAVKGGAADQGAGWQDQGLEDFYPGYKRIRSRSGVLASDDGYVLTCGHLFDPKDAPPADVIVDVEVNGGQHFRAWIVGIEPTVDLAVLKVEAPIGLPPASFGDSDGVRTGRFAIAVGDPPGPELTFAFGTISAKAKEECYQDDRTSTLLQWSSRVDAESLGGPLVDLDGNVIGITIPSVAGTLRAGQAEGPTYALPIKLVRTLFDALKVKQSTISPWLGFSVRPLNWERRRAMHGPQFGGIEIANVFDPSPASRLGIRVGDLLLEMNGNRINAVHDFQYWLYVFGIGKTVTLKLFHDGRYLERQATIELRPAAAVPR
jgi:S1-C subfamily serine protease